MNRLIINNRTDISDANALDYVKATLELPDQLAKDKDYRTSFFQNSDIVICNQRLKGSHKFIVCKKYGNVIR